MKKIDKHCEPKTLNDWKRKNPTKYRYEDLSYRERQAINQACIEEQYALCAYCCKLITEETSHNEHVESRSSAPQRELDFANMVASCNTQKQCGLAHGHQPLPLTPLMPECETELKFYLSGRVKGLTERAKKSIQVLNLGDQEGNNRSLIEMRKQMIDSLIYQQGESPDELDVLEDELLAILIEDLSQPKNGKLSPFSPVLINILKDLQPVMAQE